MPALSTTMGHEPGLYELLAALPSQLQPHVRRPEDGSFLHDMFRGRSLQSLIKIHTRLQHFEDSRPDPALKTVEPLVSEICDQLQGKTSNGEIRELLSLLSRPHVKSLLSVHDTVAQQNYDPELPPLPEDLDEDEDSVKIIRLVKNKEPLGATIRQDDPSGAIVIARIMRGGAADRSGLIHVGDELKEVNGIPVDDKKPEEIIRILAQSQGAITFKVVPGAKEEAPVKEPQVFMKALFDYSPGEDQSIPCREAGLSFMKGSVLQVVSQDDATWWQARHEGETHPRAGLIPSKHFQERRFALRQTVSSLPSALRRSTRRSSGFRRSFRLSRREKKTNKWMYECKKSELYDTADVPTYEEVTLHRRLSADRHRLVVLVGPSGVGMNALKRKLLVSDPQHFSVTIPHTSRPKKNQETDGVEYHFISKHMFEADIHNNKFVEYGEYHGNYYGTSLDAIRSVLNKRKVCLIDVQPQSIKHLRTAEFKPFVVFVKPPSVERLRETRKHGTFISGKDEESGGRSFTEEDFQEMVQVAQQMEVQYGHLFEKVIVNDDLSAAFSQLYLALKSIETEAHWVPVSWTHS